MVQDPKGRKYKLKLPPVTFLLCLVIAGIGWAIVNFSKEYHVTLNYRIVCNDLPENIDTVMLSDSIVKLTFNTKGLNYLNPKYSEQNCQLFISVKSILKNNSKKRQITLRKKNLNDYIRKEALFGNDFVEVEYPEELILYLK